MSRYFREQEKYDEMFKQITWELVKLTDESEDCVYQQALNNLFEIHQLVDSSAHDYRALFNTLKSIKRNEL